MARANVVFPELDVPFRKTTRPSQTTHPHYSLAILNRTYLDGDRRISPEEFLTLVS
ncbi:hypothetical protein [Nocardia wallacei]|uniref:hypothetical protein n=1 Tax=Nocardia wallacei TaxID=480035 RepID=UPI002453D7B4|nr:hypothetical protein [Nocardia wallacei]